jgi:translation initiation factor IF-1
MFRAFLILAKMKIMYIRVLFGDVFPVCLYLGILKMGC